MNVDVFAAYANSGYLVYAIGRGGSPMFIDTHYPWFMVYAKQHSLEKTKKVLESLAKRGLIIKYEVHDPSSVTPLIMKGARYEPDSSYVPVEVRCKRKEVVPSVAERVKSSVGDVYVGEHNIVYPVRVSFDFDIKFFHERCPVLFTPNSELEPIAMEIIERQKDFKVLAFDIEVYTTSGRFPVPGDPILSLQYGVTTLGNPDIHDPRWVKDSVNIIVASKADAGESEDIAAKFLDVLRKERPDVVVGYNSASFDMKYLKPFLGQRKERILADFYHVNLVDYVFPHVDLLQVRKSMGSSLGLRSQVAQALDDVVKEVARGTKFEWVVASDLMDAESRLDHIKLVPEWASRSTLFFRYVTADVYFTLILSYMWMYTLILLSAMVQVPITQLSKLNLGQVAEYNFVHWLERLGFKVSCYERRSEFRKASDIAPFSRYLRKETAALFTKGKVYVRNYGTFTNVVEGDFSQLYPTLMSNDSIDPTGIRLMLYTSAAGHEPVDFSDPLIWHTKLREKRFPVVLGVKEKKSSERMVPRELLVVVPTYGPLSFLIYKMFTMRRVTKALKKRAVVEGRPELISIDQSVKILNNASYGAMSKRRGFINPVLSGYVFWKTLNILYDVIDYAEKALGLEVLYGDTDSIFVKCKEDEASRLYPGSPTREACFRWFKESVVPKINEYVRSKYGKEFELNPEDAFDVCVYPKSKYSNAPSKKSYICVNVGEGRSLEVALLKGEFYKATAPEGLKDKIEEFYAEILRKMPRTPEEVARIVEDLLRPLPPHKYFVKKTVDSFESDVRRDDKVYELTLKRLNKTFHYAALHVLFTTYEKIPDVRRREIKILSDVETAGGRCRSVAYVIDAEKLVRERGNVVVYFMPSSTPTKFTVFADYCERSDLVTVHSVSVKRAEVVTEQRENRVYADVGYRVEETYCVEQVPREKILVDSIRSMQKYIVDDVARKLLPSLHKFDPRIRDPLDRWIGAGSR